MGEKKKNQSTKPDQKTNDECSGDPEANGHAIKPFTHNTVKQPNRTYWDSMFRMLFNDEKQMIELYNGLMGTSYGPDTQIEIRTLDNALYLDIKNDLAFIIARSFLNLTEHQSTISPNLPVRMGGYWGRVMEELLGDRVYRETLVRLPAPVFFVLYNGTKDFPEEKLYRLSDSFLEKPPENSIEVMVKVVNISYTKGGKILQRSRTLWEYSRFVHLVQTYLKETGSLEEAVRLGILDAEREGILREFLKKHGTEVLGMLFKEVTQERYGEIREEEGFERGLEQGLKQKALDAAVKFKNAGVELKVIAECTGVPLVEIEKM